MRVPVYDQDLTSGSGFSRIAKNLKRDWPGAEPIGLSKAQNILARCFGYSDYHDVRSSPPSENPDLPSLALVVAQCMKTLSAELLGGGRWALFDMGELQEKIFGWPFLQLSAYREHYGHSDSRLAGQLAKAELIQAFLATQKTKPKPYVDKLHIEKLLAMTGHKSTASTAGYVPTSMGVCLNELPYGTDRSSISPDGKCVTCGPSTQRTLH
nr:hypothetical protein [uncultured Pseudomonas sp.]